VSNSDTAPVAAYGVQELVSGEPDELSENETSRTNGSGGGSYRIRSPFSGTLWQRNRYTVGREVEHAGRERQRHVVAHAMPTGNQLRVSLTTNLDAH
jgi:hypothetical protein